MLLRPMASAQGPRDLGMFTPLLEVSKYIDGSGHHLLSDSVMVFEELGRFEVFFQVLIPQFSVDEMS